MQRITQMKLLISSKILIILFVSCFHIASIAALFNYKSTEILTIGEASQSLTSQSSINQTLYAFTVNETKTQANMPLEDVSEPEPEPIQIETKPDTQIITSQESNTEALITQKNIVKKNIEKTLEKTLEHKKPDKKRDIEKPRVLMQNSNNELNKKALNKNKTLNTQSNNSNTQFSQSTQPTLSDRDIIYVKKPTPTYPLVSRKLQEQGIVIVLLHLDENGIPISVKISKSSGFTRLDNAAMQAANNTRIKPYLRQGQRIKVRVNIPISFNLSH